MYIDKMSVRTSFADINNMRDPERSPARKRSRLDPSIIDPVGEFDNDSKAQAWKFLCKGLSETMADVGVGQLVDSDVEEHNEKENLPDFLDLTASSASLAKEEKENSIAEILQSTISNKTLQKMQNGQWDDVLEQQSKRELIYKIDHFEALPDELILQIFHILPRRELAATALVCQRWRRLAQDESLWTRMDLANAFVEPGALGHLLSRQVLVLRLRNAEVNDPVILPGVEAIRSNFKCRLLYLDLSMAHMSTDSLAILFSKCYRLKKVSLEHMVINSSVLQNLAKSKDLEVLNLVMAEGINEEGLKHLLSSCRKLKELNLGWTYLSSAAIKYACSHFPSSLDRLNMSGCRKLIYDNNVLDLVKKCPSLRELDLSDCTGLTGDAVDYIVQLQCLNFLALSRCYFIPHVSLLQLHTVSSLMYLDVHGGYITPNELETVDSALGPKVQINKFKFSSIARPTVAPHRSSIWGFRVRDC